jgi:hypothetical protein
MNDSQQPPFSGSLQSPIEISGLFGATVASKRCGRSFFAAEVPADGVIRDLSCNDRLAGVGDDDLNDPNERCASRVRHRGLDERSHSA